MTITIHQPEYLPWLPFFDRIQKADTFVIFDDVGYQKNGFINRNKIKTNQGSKHLTVPVLGRSSHKKINEVKIDNSRDWQTTQLALLKENYRNASYFKDTYSLFQSIFAKQWEKISDLDIDIIKTFIDFLGIKVQVVVTSDMQIKGTGTERLVNICKELEADRYLSGPGGKDYMDLSLFEKENISVEFQEFAHPEYRQQFMENGFLPGLSITDLLFNEGPNSLPIIKSVQ